ncbi:MarR family winged helix-turn-helix transcriptional regulator [Ureibacillus chungkukjangi]|uniref:MarR family transcriptional regulator n=1 Tax=Ureibacillus chungkukjangi TaxID=1202712 RepID=A0A318TLH2_9BACL|nr:MarR family transcriptional regulator [Ureibacillus chungkukjangi]PYF04707.1 MarR family transcriptional regulator [Ureibacillus chungkukjangi]
MEEQNNLDLKLFRVWLKATKAVVENIQKDIANHKISSENFMILELLYSKGPHPVQKISETLSIPSGSITYVVDKLEKKGLVERQPIPNDRRASNVVLTEEGKTLFDQVFPKHATTISENFSFISDEEKELLIDLLKRIGMGAQG